MKRDFDVIRAILLALEDAPSARARVRPSDIPGYDEQLVAYNMKLLCDAGYVDGHYVIAMTGRGTIEAAVMHSMKNSGHELLDTIRSDTVWSKIKDKATTSGLELTFDLVMIAGKKVMESMLG